MQDIFINQLSEMKTALTNNVGSIKSLIRTAEELDSLITTLSSSKQDNDTVQQLTTTKDDIYSTISDLLTHTEVLAEKYKRMAEAI